MMPGQDALQAVAPTFRVVNLGCKVNRVEADTLRAKLIEAGAVESPAPGPCDLVIVNTCTVTAEADAKARKALRKASREAPGAAILASGCSVYLDPAAWEALAEGVTAQPNRQQVLYDALSILGLGEPGALDAAGGMAAPGTVFDRAGEGFRSRAGIKVQDGCANACTYCIVHVARGPVWHKPLEETLEEISAADEAGVREVVLTGVNLGSYPDLAGMLGMALRRAPHARIRLSSIEPLDVTPGLIELMAASDGRICRHLHMPLQSGCEKTLCEMARPYTPEGYRAIVQSLREAMPQISLSTDIIAGFPGETGEDFESSIAFAREMGFSKMHVFRYSRRPGTPAAARVDQVAPQDIAARAAALRRLASSMRSASAAQRAGTFEEILVESDGNATSESYFDCVPAGSRATWHELGAGTLARVHITGSDGDRLIAELA